jgi:hypothetical protein
MKLEVRKWLTGACSQPPQAPLSSKLDVSHQQLDANVDARSINPCIFSRFVAAS